MIDEEAILNYIRAAGLGGTEVLEALRELADKKEMLKMAAEGRREQAEIEIRREWEPHL